MATDPIYYGRALYYPHIHFSDIRWLKTAALYYAGIDRIVPSGYDLGKEIKEVKQLNEREGFIREISPRSASANIVLDFSKFAEERFTSLRNRSILKKTIGSQIPEHEYFPIHQGKISSQLHDKLLNLKIASKPHSKSDREWYNFDPLAGAVYMTFLANRIAEIHRLPVVTDDPIFQPLLSSTQLKKYSGQRDFGETLASIVIQSVVPENLESIPMSKIVRFREKYDDERHNFYNEINRLTQDLRGVESYSVLKDCLAAKKKDIELSVKNLQGAFNGMKISTTTAMLGLSIPAFASGLGAGIAAAGVFAVATAKLLFSGNEYYRSRKSSPYSYVLILKRRLTSESLVRQIIKGKLLL